jgi:hypothetical protein
LFVFIIVFLIVDFGLGIVLNKVYFKVSTGTIAKANYGFKFCNEDILLFGASEVSHHFISNTISDSLHLSCYNLGMDGYRITYQYPLLQTVTDRYSPKIIVISTTQLSGKKMEPSLMYPYYKNSPYVKNVLNKLDVFNKYRLMLNSYAYNSQILGIVYGLHAASVGLNGYIPLYGTNKFLTLNTKPSEITTSPESIAYFEDFLKLAKSKATLVYVFMSPKYQINNSKSDSILIKAICDRNHVSCLDYLNDTTFSQHPELFKDAVHLNNKGAEILTNKLIATIRADYSSSKK